MTDHLLPSGPLAKAAAAEAALASALASTTSKINRAQRDAAVARAELYVAALGTSLEELVLDDELDAALAELLTATEAALSTVRAQVEGELAADDAADEADQAELEHRIAQVEQRLAELEPAPAPRRVLLGAATYQRVGGWPALEQLCGGPLEVRRSFNTMTEGFRPLSSSAMFSDIAAGRASVYSFKTSTASMAAGQHDAALDLFLAAIPAGHRTWLCWRHEPDDDGEPAAEWRAAFDRFAARVLAANRPELVPTAIYTGWLWLDPTPERWPADWLPTDRRVCIGIDPYNLGNGDGTALDLDPAELFDPIVADLEARGFTRFGIGETGCETTKLSAYRLEQWMARLTAWSISSSAEFVCYFDGTGSLGDHRLTAAMAAELGRAARRP